MKVTKKNCQTCDWFTLPEYVCVNSESEYCADFVMPGEKCENWTPIDGNFTDKLNVVFDELYKCLDPDLTICVYDINNDELLYFGDCYMDIEKNPEYNNIKVSRLHMEHNENLDILWIGLNGGTDAT